jgi:hypothetical protein
VTVAVICTIPRETLIVVVVVDGAIPLVPE